MLPVVRPPLLVVVVPDSPRDDAVVDSLPEVVVLEAVPELVPAETAPEVAPAEVADALADESSPASLMLPLLPQPTSKARPKPETRISCLLP